MGRSGHDVSLAAKKDAGIVCAEGYEARGKDRRPLSASRQNCLAYTEVGEARLDRSKFGKVKLDAMHVAIVLQWLHALGRLSRETDENDVATARR